MRKFAIAAAAALFVTSGALAAPSPKDTPAKAKNDSAAQKDYEALKAEYDKALLENRQAQQQAKTDAEKSALYAKAPKADDYAAKFKAIADKNAKDPAAANCLAWIVQNSRTPQVQADALDALMAHHLASPVMGNVCQSLQYSQAPNAETFLRTVLDKSADHEAQGRACYTLARVLSSKADLAARAKADASFVKNLEQWYGKAYAAQISGTDPAATAKSAEDLFDRVVAKFTDVKYGNGSLADQAKTDLFEIRNLSVGKTAPEIAGTDENGNPMKLSDFRGKVVLLDFWGFW